MGFNVDDVEKMFAEAASASEDTGEGDVGGKPTAVATKQTKSPTKETGSSKKTVESDKKQSASVETKPREKTEKDTSERKSKSENLKKETSDRKDKAEVGSRKPEVNNRKPLVNESFDVSQGMTEHSIERVLRMNDTFNKFNNTEKQFVLGYFQVEDSKEGSISKVIYGALTASRRDLDALSKIVEARGKTAAERAFYLMSLDGNNIEAIHEQVDLLAGNLDRIDGVNDSNKIDICRVIESTISGMPDNMFAYIDKLQSFTNQALEQ